MSLNLRQLKPVAAIFTSVLFDVRVPAGLQPGTNRRQRLTGEPNEEETPLERLGHIKARRLAHLFERARDLLELKWRWRLSHGEGQAAQVQRNGEYGSFHDEV